MKLAALIAAAIAIATPAVAQQLNSYNAPGSPYTNYNWSDGSRGTSYHAPGSPYTNTTINGANGETRNCTTYRAAGSPFVTTNCN